MSTYSNLTFNDKNPIKRWLQSSRLTDALKLTNGMPLPSRIIDYGAGNGELCKHLLTMFPNSEIICYEPTPYLMGEAKENLAGFEKIIFASDVSLMNEKADLIFCLEVFEHLPEKETAEVIRNIARLLAKNGRAIVGVPVEIGIPALLKGLFRMTRRFGAYDATLRNVISSLLYSPPTDRPLAQITPELGYYHEHMGFDYRRLLVNLREVFSVEKIRFSPFRFLKGLNTEVNIVIGENLS